MGRPDAIDRIWLDGQRRVALDRSTVQVGVPAAHRAGFTGRGVRVAVLDTGVDTAHPDLAGRVAESRNFSADPQPGDTVGHGTHVASIIAGGGTAPGGRFQGVAPDATLLSGKVCESYGCTESAILAGMRWAAVEARADVINMSLGGIDTPELDPLEQAVNRLTEQTGALFVIAAGNAGEDASIGSPGSAAAALTVGAVERDDELAFFSSRGPRVGDDAVKPEVTAPGVGIVAARAGGTRPPGDLVGEHHVALSGTSMAAPHVAGAAALLRQQQPGWRAAQLKSALTNSARPHPRLGAFEQGAGRLDVARATAARVGAHPPVLSYGRTLWPHHDDEPMDRTVTYHNASSAPVTLNLTLRVPGPEGRVPPAGMFTLSANRVVVPALGRAQVTVTVDTSRNGPDGYYSGHLLATGAGEAVSVPLGVHQEEESYQLTVNHVDRDGRPALEHGTVLIGLDTLRFEYVHRPDGTATLRLPKGRYGVTSYLLTDRGGQQNEITMLARPELTLTRDSTLTLDARRARPVVVTVPKRSARTVLAELGANYFTEYGSFGISLLGDSFANLSSGHLGSAVPASRFTGVVASQWARPDGDKAFARSPYLYVLSETVAGRIPTGFVRHYRDRHLATVKHEFQAGAPGQLAERVVFPIHSSTLGGWAAVLPIATPGRRVEHYLARGVRWASELIYGVPDEHGWLDGQIMFQSGPTGLDPQRRYRERWNFAPFGPTLSAPRFAGEGVTRIGDLIRIALPLHADAAGHPGGSRVEEARTALYRDGVLVGVSPEPGWGDFPVPAAAADYRLTTSVVRSVTDLSTRVEAEWGFRSAQVGEDQLVRLPVLAVRFAPKLSAGDTAPADGPFRIPVSVQRQTDGAPVRVDPSQLRSLTVDVSYDDGRSWRPARVRPAGDGWTVLVDQPTAGASYASLRASATDLAGNTVTQRVIHAYRVAAVSG